MKSKLTAIVLATTMLSTQAWAGCMAAPEKTALKIETLQQELMVAGLICNDANPYNAFVLANRPELVQSDHDLEMFYTKLYSDGTAQFQTVKTRLANHFSLDSLHNQQGFCQNASALFGGLQYGAPLATQVSWISIDDTKESCERGAPIVETVEGGGGLPQTQVAGAPADPGAHQAGPDPRVAQNSDGRYADPRAYYPPPPAPYWQAPPSHYHAPASYYPPNYYPGYGW